MLDGLAAVDWKNLEHAYGPATDVPDMIRALGSPDAGIRDSAMHSAFGNIFHQGTRYPATPAALPFLVELAAQPHPEDVAGLLGLIVRCTAGYFTPTWGPCTASGAAWGDVAPPMSDYGETPELLERIELAAEPAVPLCAKLLTHSDPGVRQRAAWLLAALRRFADRYEIVPRLEAAYAAEQHAGARALIAFAIGHLAARRSVEIFESDRDDLVRAVAMLIAARRGETTPAMVDAVLGWLDDRALGDAFRELCFDGDLAPALSSALRLSGPAALERAMPKLVGRLATDDTFAVVGVLGAALAGRFPEPPPKHAAELTAEQRELLTTLVANQGFWMIGNALSVLMHRGLPSTREAMAAYLGVPVVIDVVAEAKQHARMAAAFGPERALELWRDVLDKAPDDLDGLRAVATLLVELGDDAEAAPIIERLPAGDPTGEFLRGSLAYSAGELDAALAHFTAAEAAAGDDKVRDLAHENRIAILQQLGRAREALELELAKRAPSTAEDWYHRGLAQVKAGDYAGCIASIGTSLEGQPDRATAHYTIACAYALSGRAGDALAAIARALELDPELAGDIAADADFASLANDPRFVKLVGR